MKIKAFFDNLGIYFEDDDDNDAPIRASAYKNDEGDIFEIRIFNPDYNEMLVISSEGTMEAISIDDYVEEK
jgi:hypothetical protein